MGWEAGAGGCPIFPKGPPHSQVTGTAVRCPVAILLGPRFMLGFQHVLFPTFLQITALRSYLIDVKLCSQLTVINLYRSAHMCVCVRAYVRVCIHISIDP